MATTYCSEKAMICDLKKGSLAAFDNIYKLYAEQLFLYCKRYTKSRQEAEEIVQDVFVKLWNKRTEIQQEDSLRSLLFIISKNMLISAYRSKVNHPIYEEYVCCLEMAASDKTDYVVEYQDFERLFHKHLQSLPPTQQNVITLSRLHDLPHKEIAEQLALSEQTVKNQLSIGLKTLRELLKRAIVPYP